MQRRPLGMLVRTVALAGVVWVTALCSVSPAADILLVREGGPKAIIIVPAKLAAPRPPNELEGAFELAEYLEKITARKVPVTVEGKGSYMIRNGRRRLVPFSDRQPVPAGIPEVHVGWTSVARQAVDRARVEKLDLDGFLIRTTPERVFIVGKSGWGSYFGCVWLLERHCDVRWYLPGEIGEEYPRQATVSVPSMDVTVDPAFKHREFSGPTWKNYAIVPGAEKWPNVARDLGEYMKWHHRNRLRRRLKYHHNLWRVFSVEKYGRLYPDLYPQFEGKKERFIPDPAKNSHWQPCLSHPKAVDIVMDYAREFFAANPDAGSISLAFTDGGVDSHCCCERCQPWIDKGLPPNMRRAREYFTFINKVATRFDKEFPDKCIGHLLYAGASAYPENMKIHPRVVTFLVKQSYRVYGPETWKDVQRNVDDLTRSATAFGIYDWFYGFWWSMPRTSLRQLDTYMKYMYAKGARHSKAEAYFNWGMDGFKYWVYTQLMWDPNRKLDNLLDDFYGRFFKESAAPMRAYFDTAQAYLEKAVKDYLAAHPGDEKGMVLHLFRALPTQFEAMPPEAIEECRKHLDAAAAAARSQIVMDRVDFFRRGFGLARIMATRYHVCKEAMPLLAEPATYREGLERLARLLNADMDTGLYYRRAIERDRCVVFPGRGQFGALNRALSAAAAPLREQLVADLCRRDARKVGASDIDAAVTGLVREAVAGIADADAREAVRGMLAAAAGKVVFCGEVARPPVVDGRMDDPCWTRAPAYSDFTALGKGTPKYVTRFRTVRHGSRLYVGVECFEDPGLIVTHTRVRDENVWTEDSIEFFLNKLTDTELTQRCQVIVNPKGNLFDYFDGTDKWDGDIPVAARIDKDRWTFEFSIPLDAIGIDPAATPFVKCNVVRNAYAPRGRGKLLEESAGWAPTAENFLVLASRGLLFFGGRQ